MFKCPICEAKLIEKNNVWFCESCKDEIPLDCLEPKKSCCCNPCNK